MSTGLEKHLDDINEALLVADARFAGQPRHEAIRELTWQRDRARELLACTEAQVASLIADRDRATGVLALELQALATRSEVACVKRGWSMKWNARGCYLMLESAELIEALRGKGASTPEEETADVLTVLLSIIGAFKLDVSRILQYLDVKLGKIERGEIGGSPLDWVFCRHGFLEHGCGECSHELPRSETPR